jgi:zinc and cadmium transporter
MILILIILFSLLGSVGSILAAGSFLLFPKKIQKFLVPNLVAYATGTLLTAALLGLIPHALEHLEPFKVLLSVLIGIIMFFVLEKLVIFRHCHKENCNVHMATGPMIIIGDAFHNFIDGVIITASFLISIPVGIATSISVIAHEIPQEVGDFGILLHSGYSKKKALFYNLFSSLSTLVGAILAYISLATVKSFTPYIMGISAASFLYIALVDLAPGLHTKLKVKQSVQQFVFMLLGVGTILLILNFAH